MFTVLICDKHIEDDCRNKYYIYLKPFLDNNQFSFCEWNPKGDSLDEALPELKNIIRGKKEWRAIVVNDSSTWDFDAVNKRNPFDFVDRNSSNVNYNDFSQILEYRKKEEAVLNKALTNPLTKLAIWLSGSPVQSKPEICYNGYEDTIETINDSVEYFSKIKELGISATELECDRIRLNKYKKMINIFGTENELFNMPKNIIAISERTKDVEKEHAEAAWKSRTEFEYSQFYLDNLYPDKLRYLIYDIPYIKGRKNENNYFNFLTFLLVLASNEYPNGVLRSNRVYAVNVEIDSDCVKDLCQRYNAKLMATLTKIKDISRKLTEKEHEPVDRDTAEVCFETNVTVPVEIDPSFDKKNLFVEHKKIGLSKDCPANEYTYWDEQYHSVNKLFIRYLREPRRAVKTSVKEAFRRMNKNDDERALQLNEFQKEDVLIYLQNEEINMLSSVTTHLYDTAKYKSQMDEADKSLKTCINQRMTKRKTVYIGLIAALAYFMGFIPLFWSNLNNMKSILFSLALTGICLGIFMVCGFIYLFPLRKKLVDKFKNFNNVMSDITSEIDDSLAGFSEYLSHTCNVMRSYSVLNYSENSYSKRQGVLRIHQNIITEKIKEVNELFTNYIDSNEINAVYGAQPYDYDFTKMENYDYIIPYTGINKSIDFMQEGNVVLVPVDYLKSISVIREELYD